MTRAKEGLVLGIFFDSIIHARITTHHVQHTSASLLTSVYVISLASTPSTA